MATDLIVFDTSVFIDQLRTNKYEYRFLNLKGLIRCSSVVLSELARGATSEVEKDFIKRLAKNHPVITPSEKNWIDSGDMLARINADKGFLPEKLRSLHFDMLIALSARNYGATVITSNRSDFELIREYKEFRLEIW